MNFHNPARGLQPIQFRHVDVHGDDVWLQAPDSLYGFLAVTCRTDDTNTGVRTKYVYEKFAHHERIFHYQNLDQGCCPVQLAPLG